MFLLIHLFTGFPLLLGSIMAGCCRSRFAIRAWTVAAMLMPTLLLGAFCVASLVYGSYDCAGIAVVLLLFCYAVSRAIRWVVFQVRHALLEPGDDAADDADGGDGGDCGD